uniref:ZnF_CDGSH domain-containing protein n=1 Tax=Angiostrongylus cantonensis TaxID=6313 RepID=A0A0K0DF24_ANGCA
MFILNFTSVFTSTKCITPLKNHQFQIGYKLALRKARVNYKIQLANEKVVDTIDMEDIGDKKAFCRCWKSDKVFGLYPKLETNVIYRKAKMATYCFIKDFFQFPYCDGSHSKHNKEVGDNVGPLVIKGKH